MNKCSDIPELLQQQGFRVTTQMSRENDVTLLIGVWWHDSVYPWQERQKSVFSLFRQELVFIV